MSINETIISVLSPLEIPVFPDVCEEKNDEYIVFNYTDESYEGYSDDVPECSYPQLYVHYFVRGKSPLATRNQICKLLVTAGFDVTPGPIMYETDTKYHHAVISVGKDCTVDM